MSKKIVADILKGSLDVTGAAAQKAATDLFAGIERALERDGKFVVPGFGSFTVTKTEARIGKNPRTGADIEIPAGKSVRFKAARTLKSRV